MDEWNFHDSLAVECKEKKIKNTKLRPWTYTAIKIMVLLVMIINAKQELKLTYL